MKRIKLKVKFITGFFGVAAIIAIVAGVGYINMQIIKEGSETIYIRSLPPIRQLGAVEAAVYKLRGDVIKAALIPALRDTVEADAQASIDTVDQNIVNYRAVDISPLEKETLDKFDPLWKSYQLVIRNALDKIAANDIEGATEVLSDPQAVTVRDEMDQILVNLIRLNQSNADDLNNRNRSVFENTTWVLILVTAFGVLMAISLGWFLAVTVINPLDKLTKASQQIARSDLEALSVKFDALAKGDLTRSFYISTQPVAIEAQDEIGELASAFNEMINHLRETGQSFGLMVVNLRNLITSLSDDAGRLNAASQQLVESASQAEQTTNQISNTMQQVALGIGQQSESLNKTVASVEQMSRAINGVANGAEEQSQAVSRAAVITTRITSAIRQVSENARTGANGATQAAEIARAGAQTVEETISGMQAIKEKVNISAQKVHEMGEHSNQIGAIVETIDDIASQTNLLALNAAIEAARAGEHGKGFAVVADEVRKLAERSSHATKEIEKLIQGIQTTVTESVTAMNEGAREVERGVEHAGQSDKALSNILKAVEMVNSQVDEIAAAAGEIEKSSGELVDAMDSVSAVVEQNTASTEEMAAGSMEVSQSIESIAAVSEENSAAVEQISAGATEMSDQVKEVSAAALSMTQMAKSLQSLVSQFNVDGEQDIVKNIERGKKDTLECLQSLEDLMAGNKHIDFNEESIPSHTDCHFGLWYYSTGQIVLKDMAEFVAYEDLHIRFHQLVREVAKTYQQGGSKEKQALEKMPQVRELSAQMHSLLDRIQQKWINRK
ncbi:MAG: methyl-accepting chemotaxis protein [Anaerolineae bacterium]|nr:methyl-accepting chemotaxis protein [Anaerolineae bacterium]